MHSTTVVLALIALAATVAAQNGEGCMMRGQCVGEMTTSLPTELITDCYEACQAEDDCLAFSYNYGSLECQTYSICDEVDNEAIGDWRTGERECYPAPPTEPPMM